MALINALKKISPALFVAAVLVAPAAAQTTTPSKPAAQAATSAPAQSQPDPSRECGCEAGTLPEVLATVGDVRVTQADISPEARKRVADLQRQVVEARRRELDLQINTFLLEAEARRRGVSAKKLLEDEVVAKTQEPTEADAQKFYDENKARIQAEFKDIKADVVTYLREQRQRDLAAKLSDTLRAAAQVKKMVEAATPPATDADRARVFATVNGKNITSAEVEDNLRPLVFSVQEEVYKLRRQEVELKVNDVLLNQEAQRRKVTTAALLDAEVTSKVPAVTEADAQKFYDENRARIDGDFAQLKEQIVQYLRDVETRKATLALADRLRAAARVQTFLAPPAPPVYKIDTADQPSKGGEKAAVTLVEFTDYQCPSCAKTQPALDRIAAEYGERVRLVVRDFPLSQHADAQKAAEAAEAAREQGKYWEYVAILFQ
ncbi:MAG TPA: thioredoxin domain-containing protein, partial [Pyrinomonadaceae bacterium]|nr:thioredoxin domain-containing protein [Pyrinomonadaceae bacterium]